MEYTSTAPRSGNHAHLYSSYLFYLDIDYSLIKREKKRKGTGGNIKLFTQCSFSSGTRFVVSVRIQLMFYFLECWVTQKAKLSIREKIIYTYHSNSLNGVQKNLKMAPMVTECYLNIALCMVKQCPMQ